MATCGKILRRTLRTLMVGIPSLVGLYFLVAILLGAIPVAPDPEDCRHQQHAYLTSNGIHAEVVLRAEDLDSTFLQQLALHENAEYLSFGWGDRNFYLETPTWDRMKAGPTLEALFWPWSRSLVHLTVYDGLLMDWIPLELCQQDMQALQQYLRSSFQVSSDGSFTSVEAELYGVHNYFYEGRGHYHVFYTCNTWLNRGLKRSGQRAALWTPFDRAILRKHE